MLMSEVIRIERLRRRWSQEYLAELTGWNASKISRLESGIQEINVSDLETLSRAFDTTPEALIAARKENLSLGTAK